MSLTTVKDLVVNLVSKAGTTYRVPVVVSLTTLIAGLRQYAKHLDAKHGQQTGAGTIVPAAKSNATAAKANKVAVDGRFFKRFMRLLKIMIPGPFSPEAGYMLLVAITMIGRTYCDVWMLTNGTAIERSIITRDRKSFLHHLSLFVLAMSPLAIITNLLKYGLNELKLRFRTRLTNHLYKSYMQGFTFYQVSNLDNRITNADQLLTQDVEKFCTSVSDLYSNVSKPLLDMVVYARALSTSIGAMGPLQMLGYLVFSGFLLTNLRKPTGRYTVQEQQLEGEFRFVNSRLITSSEEVAFYNGNKREQVIIDSAFKRLTRHLRQSIQFRGLIGYIDSIIAKYFATVVGFLVLSRPYLSLTAPTLPDSDNSEVMEDYYRNGRMLVNLAKAMGRLVLAGRELTRLAGFTSRVDELDTVLRDLHKGKYERTMVSNQEGAAGIEQEKLVPNSGKIIEMDRLIRFDNVPLVTPNGDVLIRRMNFEVQAGMNVLVAGPNGCGKSSLFRILGGLWPLFGGTLVKPKTSQLFYVPQRPYLTLGTLRDQVIYPHSVEEMHAAGTTDADLLQLLSHVQLQYLAQRPGGWDAIEDWADVLSGGEKQRVAMARLFYHKPQFAILDECTSAVSVDVEGFMYTYCRETLKISLFTVSHRQSLWKYHDYVLQFSGRGEYEFKKIDNSTPVYGS